MTSTPVTGSLVGSTLLLSTSDADTTEYTTGCLLYAQQTPATAATLSQWAQAYTATLTRLGWTLTATNAANNAAIDASNNAANNAATTSESAAPPATAVSSSGSVGFHWPGWRPDDKTAVPWEAIQTQMSHDFPALAVAPLAALVAQLPPAGQLAAAQAQQWTSATVLDGVAVAAIANLDPSPDGDPVLSVSLNAITYPAAITVQHYPNVPVATRDLNTFYQSVQATMPAARIPGLLAELKPKISGALTKIIPLTASS